jgi:hypothetical protein
VDAIGIHPFVANSGGEDLVEQRSGLLLVDLLRERELGVRI